MFQPLAHLAPTAIQLADYTDKQVLPPVEVVEFRPGNGRGRPPKGKEAIVAHTMAAVRTVLKSGAWTKYRTIKIRFQDDPHVYMGTVEKAFNKTLLVIQDLGIVTSVA
jgi:hypothetical protein